MPWNGEIIYGSPRDTYEEAEDDRRELLKSGLTARPKEVPTFAEWAFEQSQGAYGKGLAARSLETVEDYRLRYIEGKPLGALRLDDVTPPLLRAWFQDLRGESRRKADDGRGGFKIIVEQKQVSPAYKHRIKAYFSKLFTLAVESNLLDGNPCKGIRLPAITERENAVLEAHQIQPVIGSSRRIDGIILLCSLCGLRPTEARLLRWDQIDRQEMRISCPGSKTVGSRRPVPLPQDVLDAIDAQPKVGPYVFTTRDRKPLTVWRLRDDWQARRKELGWPEETRLQDLRGTFVSLLVDLGVDVRTTMELARHSSPTTTLKAYARAREQSRRDAQTALVDVIRGTNKGHKAEIM